MFSKDFFLQSCIGLNTSCDSVYTGMIQFKCTYSVLHVRDDDDNDNVTRTTMMMTAEVQERRTGPTHWD